MVWNRKVQQGVEKYQIKIRSAITSCRVLLDIKKLLFWVLKSPSERYKAAHKSSRLL